MGEARTKRKRPSHVHVLAFGFIVSKLHSKHATPVPASDVANGELIDELLRLVAHAIRVVELQRWSCV